MEHLAYEIPLIALPVGVAGGGLLNLLWRMLNAWRKGSRG